MQASYLHQDGVIEIRNLPGASDARLLRWLGKGDFAAKCYRAIDPYTLLSEWLCARIAIFLGLPIPGIQTVPYGGLLWFGSEFLEGAEGFHSGMERALVNMEDVFGMLAFDALICNRDRNPGNMLFQLDSPGSQSWRLTLIDHSHALLGQYEEFSEFEQSIRNYPDPETYLNPTAFELRGLVHELSCFDPWLHKIEGITEKYLTESLAAMPDEWNPTPDQKSLIIEFLLRRKVQVRDLLRKAATCFPNLNPSQGGSEDAP